MDVFKSIWVFVSKISCFDEHAIQFEHQHYLSFTINWKWSEERRRHSLVLRC
jgi:hypothetical protein